MSTEKVEQEGSPRGTMTGSDIWTHQQVAQCYDDGSWLTFQVWDHPHSPVHRTCQSNWEHHGYCSGQLGGTEILCSILVAQCCTSLSVRLYLSNAMFAIELSSRSKNSKNIELARTSFFPQIVGCCTEGAADCTYIIPSYTSLMELLGKWLTRPVVNFLIHQ